MAVYRRLWQGLQYQQIFTNIPVHERILGDVARRDAYQRAIARYVQPGHTVIDLGMGILSFMAVGQHPGKIYAIGFRLSVGDLIVPHTWRWSLTVEGAATSRASAGVRDA